MPTEVPTRQFSDRELKASYWYVTHKLSLRWWWTAFIFLVAFCFWLYFLWQMIFWAISVNAESIMIKKMVFGSDFNLLAAEQEKPKPLSLSSIIMMPGENKRNDFFIEATNPNRFWLATFDYQFVSPDLQTQKRKGFVLPGEKKYLLDLGLETNSIVLEATNQKWQKFGNFERLRDDRLRFSISDQKFISSQGPNDANQAVFKIKNESAFNYWQVGVQVFLINGGEFVSANYIVLDQFKTGETRSVSLSWHEQLPRINEILVVPEVNITDESNIMPQEGEGEGFK